MRKIKPAQFDVYYNDEDFVLMIKPMSITDHETMFHVVTETAYADSSYELLSSLEIEKKYGIKL